MLAVIILSGVVLLILYLWHINRILDSTPPEAEAIVQKPWTEKEMRDAFDRIQKFPIDVKPFIPSKQGRRYIVVGGSGLVGSWIVQHLLDRGEDPAAIRILDLRAPIRPEIVNSTVPFLSTDVSDPSSVAKGFEEPWPNSKIAKLPLTVFHSASIISGGYGRTMPFMPIYDKINVGGTRLVLDAAKKAGTTCFVATSSGSVAQRRPEYWVPPWRRWPKYYFQYIGNADVRDYDGPLTNYASCYAYSKAKAEKIVLDSDDQAAGFRTGCIRPGHAIYGHGVDSQASLSWDYLRRGGTPTWIANMTQNFVNVQNVSIGHLCLERALIESSQTRTRTKTTTQDVGGNAYCITDPNPPIKYGHFYNLLMLLAHPSTPINFPRVAPISIFLPSYLIEWYSFFDLYIGRKLGLRNLIAGDIGVMQPTIFNLCSLHLVYSSERAEKEIGFKAPIGTLDGYCMAVADWNEKAEAKAKAGESNGSANVNAQKTVIPGIADAN